MLGGGSGTGLRFPCHVCFCECASETSRVAPPETCPDFMFFLSPVVQFSEVSAIPPFFASGCLTDFFARRHHPGQPGAVPIIMWNGVAAAAGTGAAAATPFDIIICTAPGWAGWCLRAISLLPKLHLLPAYSHTKWDLGRPGKGMLAARNRPWLGPPSSKFQTPTDAPSIPVELAAPRGNSEWE